MSQVSEEVEMVFGLLETVPIGVSYNDSTGVRTRDIEVRFSIPTADVESFAKVPAQVAKELVLPQLEAEFAEEELKIRSAYIYHDVLQEEHSLLYVAVVTV